MKTIIFLLLLVLNLPYSNAQTTAIPDTAFEQKLLSLGMDSDGLVNGQILNSDAAIVTSLDIDASGIHDLTGIEAFTNLIFLRCNSNSISTLDLSNNTALEQLFCESTDLTSLDLSSNTSLIYCYLNHNTSLSNLSLPATNTLLLLRCNSSIISNLDVSNNLGLVNLSCSSPNLSNLDLSNNAALTHLTCITSHNLTSLNLSGATALTNLLCSGNNSLTTLDLSNNTALVHANCAANDLNTLLLPTTTTFKILDCSSNNLSSLDLSNSTALEEVNCNNNNINTLNSSNLSALTDLSCNKNNLSNLNLSTNTALNELYCNHNNFNSIDVSNNTALTRLDCSDNNLSNLDVSNNTALTNLYADANHLNNLDVSNNTALAYYHCTNNSLSKIHLSNHTALRVLRCNDNNINSIDVSNSPLLSNLFCQNNDLHELDLTNNPLLLVFKSENNLPYMAICVADAQAASSNISWAKDLSATYIENCQPLAILGKVVKDDDLDCIVDSLETIFSPQTIKFVRNSDGASFYFSNYDSLGNYAAYLDTGTYTASVIPSNPYWKSCPSNQQIVVDSNYNLQTIDWTIQPLINCPYLDVDIAAPFLRMTGGGSNYTVSYCNHGTMDAQNAYVEVDLDPALNFVNASLPITSQTGTLYTFNLGTVGVGQCGDFTIQVLVDTNSQFQQTHCTDVHIYPDSICLPPWTGPIVDGSSDCQNDTVFFLIENTGTNMLVPQNYTIFEDDIAMRIGNVQLNNSQTTTIVQLAAEGKTYRIEVEQMPGYPAWLGDPVFSEAVEGCNPYPDGSFNTGFITQFSNGNTAPHIAVDCQENVASYDPNDKAAQPAGYGVQHYIEQNIPIDYKVRFQNTGTDTAFNIYILDTLSAYLDIASLTMGASSHSYTWELNGNVLKVSFPNIMLVDSNANEPLSHGFFRYRINQVANNPLGSVIENTAAIYFDYNPPVITNTTFHTIGENFVPIVLSVGRIYEEQIQVQAFPNPFQHSTSIQVHGKSYETLQLTVFDLSGKAITSQEENNSNQLELHRGKLQAGMYIYQLKGDGQLINTGKLMVQ